ncbi:MAG: CHAT domain-containing protein, partial [Acidobacteriota bacterium]
HPGVAPGLAERVHRSLSQPASDRHGRRAALRELSRLVLEPALALVSPDAEVKRWLVVPDGALHYVPFAALPVSAAGEGAAEPLLVRTEVVHLPSLTARLRLRAAARGVHDGPALAVVADPVYQESDPRFQALLADSGDLAAAPAAAPVRRPFARERLTWSGEEARAIVDAAGGSRDVHLALGFDAALDLVGSQELGQHRIVHLAAHGVLDGRHPELSGLMFSRWRADRRPRESFLRLHDIYALRWRAELVVLSGCATAAGVESRSEGVTGLAQGFLEAGAGDVVASLWPVRDRATAELMARFYKALLGDGLTPSAALRRAQLSMRGERRFGDAYFWAPFLVIGDGAAP